GTTAWTVGRAYSSNIAITGGLPPHSSLTVSGLPTGLSASLSGSTITLSGTPTTVGDFNAINVSVKDATGAPATATQHCAVNAAPSLGALGTTAWTVGRAYSSTITITGGWPPHSNLTVSGLPTGLSASLSGSTITISGTPTTVGDFNAITVSVQDASGAVAN